MGNFGAASPQMLAPTSPISTQMPQPMAQVPQPSSPAPQMNQFSQQQAPERVPLIQTAQQPQTANAASGSAEQMPPAPAAPNMFKMQKGRSETLKNWNWCKFWTKIIFRFEKVVCRHFGQLWSNHFGSQRHPAGYGHAVLQSSSTASCKFCKSFLEMFSKPISVSGHAVL